MRVFGVSAGQFVKAVQTQHMCVGCLRAPRQETLTTDALYVSTRETVCGPHARLGLVVTQNRRGQRG